MGDLLDPNDPRWGAVEIEWDDPSPREIIGLALGAVIALSIVAVACMWAAG